MRILPTIVVLILATASAALAYLTWHQSVRDEGTVSTGPHRLFASAEIPVDDVARIIITRGEERLVFERAADGEWRQTEPIDYPVNVFSMRQFALAMRDLETMGEAAVGDGIGSPDETMGLDPPLGEITLEWEGGSQMVQLGRRGVGGFAYLRVGDGGPVHLVRQDLHERVLEQAPTEWRRRTLFDHAGVDSSRVVFDEPGALGYALERQRRKWTMSAPILARVDQRAVEDQLALIANVQAASFIADAPTELSQFGLNPATATLTITTSEMRMVEGETTEEIIEERLLIGASQRVEAGAAVYAMVDGRNVVFTLPRNLVEQLAAAGHLIDLRAIDVARADVRSIRIVAEEEITLSRDRQDPTKWLIEGEGEPVAAENRAVEELLTTLTEMRAVDAQGGDFPFTQEVAQITVFGYDEEPLSAARLARLEDGEWVFYSDDQVLRVFPETLSIALTRGEYLEN